MNGLRPAAFQSTASYPRRHSRLQLQVLMLMGRDPNPEGGFQLDGKAWKSLSAIAKHITGTDWSGPRFFGLKGRS